MADFRAEVAKVALEENVKASAAERYLFAPRMVPTDWGLFQSCDVGKNYTAEYTATHEGAKPHNAYAAFKAEKINNDESVSEILMASYGETQARSIGNSIPS
ncbi:hypothetical protein B9479_006436 [Cryptococcus floricola]|uniref:Uncharacterized protein n=1 Tax=Cryptococcus floricola TaxID=2591691 RepID=A0A5D3AN85_9TREE|nr:hypothetical protein B9479_006436 [Cryptococcus floricola]